MKGASPYWYGRLSWKANWLPIIWIFGFGIIFFISLS
jgi:hypothetical protein